MPQVEGSSLVLDRSGSMVGPKLEVAKACAAFLARRLTPRDELGIVLFDSGVGVLAPLGPVSPVLFHATSGIGPGGSTNLSGGWLKGVEQLSGPGGKGPRKVLLLTDGLANVGITDRPPLVAMAKRACDGGWERPRSGSARASTRTC